MREATMDWNRVEGNWKQMKRTVKQQWGKLTDDDLSQVNGARKGSKGSFRRDTESRGMRPASKLTLGIGANA
jgi:uncharacterized protein YjbJ (UPF0337 family)